jgi:hypothetical protein
MDLRLSLNAVDDTLLVAFSPTIAESGTRDGKRSPDRGPLIDYSIANDIQRIMALEYHIPVTPNGQIHLLSGDASGSGT